MPEWTLPFGGNRFSTHGAVTSANTDATAVNPNASANTEGSWTELVASAPFAADGFWLLFQDGAAVHHLFDFAIGASGSEVMVLENLYVSMRTFQARSVFIPLCIPEGARLSARAQSSGGGSYVRMIVYLMASPFLGLPAFHRGKVYGTSSADSTAVAYDPGGTGHTKGGYTEVVASTDFDIRALYVMIGMGTNATRQDARWLMDIAVGGAGSEQVVIANLLLSSATTQDNVTPEVMGPFFVHVPQGSRLSVNAQCSIVDATDRLFDVALMGFE